jgi:hypothetical protein
LWLFEAPVDVELDGEGPLAVATSFGYMNDDENVHWLWRYAQKTHRPSLLSIRSIYLGKYVIELEIQIHYIPSL